MLGAKDRHFLVNLLLCRYSMQQDADERARREMLAGARLELSGRQLPALVRSGRSPASSA